MRKKVIVVVGPTAVGKTALGIQLAKHVDGEVISGDSMQIYRGMNIGTAKVRPNEMESIPHHLIDIKEPDEAYTVSMFQTDVRRYVSDIHQRGNVPILVGGSGLYIEAALYDFSFSDQKRDPAYTKRLEQLIEQHGICPVYAELEKVDPEQAATIHPNNHRKVIRALEIFETTGKTMSERQKNEKKKQLFDILYIGLAMDRTLLYDRINRRVDQMIDEGLIDEVRSLMNLGYRETKAMKAIGYKEMIPFIKGTTTKEEAIRLLKRNSRRFAKRQYTWFNNRLPVQWYNVNEGLNPTIFHNILENVAGFMKDT